MPILTDGDARITAATTIIVNADEMMSSVATTAACRQQADTRQGDLMDRVCLLW